MLFGRLGDLLGRKRMFSAGLAVLTAASVACGPATSQGALIAARAVQGVGGAMSSAVVLGMLVALYPEPRGQARAIAVFSAVGSVGAILGTFLGGALTQAPSWPATPAPDRSAARTGRAPPWSPARCRSPCT